MVDDKQSDDQSPIRSTLERMIAGDEEAFEKILALHEKPIFNYLLRLVKYDKDTASELLQDTFIKVYNKRSQIDPEGNFKNWLYKIGTNTAYDYFRKKKRENLVSLDDEVLLETIETGSSYNTIEKEILAQDLEKALQEIRPNYRVILILYFKEEFSYLEIAEMLELPLNTVKTHLSRAKAELKVLLEKTYG